MSETRFTPGPWGWLIHDFSMATLGVLPDPGMGTPHVLDVSPCKNCQGGLDLDKDDWEWGRCCTPSKADADLIAAAPDLYEACEDALRLMRRAGFSDESCRMQIDALTRARGETVEAKQ